MSRLRSGERRNSRERTSAIVAGLILCMALLAMVIYVTFGAVLRPKSITDSAPTCGPEGRHVPEHGISHVDINVREAGPSIRCTANGRPVSGYRVFEAPRGVRFIGRESVIFLGNGADDGRAALPEICMQQGSINRKLLILAEGFCVSEVSLPLHSRSFDIKLMESVPYRVLFKTCDGHPVAGLRVAVSRASLPQKLLSRLESSEELLPGGGDISAVHVAMSDEHGIARFNNLESGTYVTTIDENLPVVRTSLAPVIGIDGRINTAYVDLGSFVVAALACDDDEILGLRCERRMPLHSRVVSMVGRIESDLRMQEYLTGCHIDVAVVEERQPFSCSWRVLTRRAGLVRVLVEYSPWTPGRPVPVQRITTNATAEACELSLIVTGPDGTVIVDPPVMLSAIDDDGTSVTMAAKDINKAIVPRGKYKLIGTEPWINRALRQIEQPLYIKNTHTITLRVEQVMKKVNFCIKSKKELPQSLGLSISGPAGFYSVIACGDANDIKVWVPLGTIIVGIHGLDGVAKWERAMTVIGTFSDGLENIVLDVDV